MAPTGTVIAFNLYSMKNILFFFLLISTAMPAQYAASFVDYSIDSVSVDSFFLRTRTITPIAGQPHSDTTIQYTLFTDTTTFINFVASKYAEIATFSARAQYLQDEKDTLGARYDRLLALGGTAESPFRAVQLPPQLMKQQGKKPKPAPESTGFWVIYTATKKPEFVLSMEEVKQNATILNPNGTTFAFKKPKKK